VAVQGVGNVGGHMVRLLSDAGYRVVAASDSRGAVQAEEGLSYNAIMAAKKNGSILDLAGEQGVKKLAAEDLVAVECDLLVPAAVEGFIHADNADRVRARVILELANGPVTSEADAILARKNIVVVPDILANAGGVTVSYFEWVQNRQGMAWTLNDVHARLCERMQAEAGALWRLAQEKRLTLRDAAYVHGLARLVEAMKARAM
jgi:glutamate dehydrogenase (NADP+)